MLKALLLLGGIACSHGTCAAAAFFEANPSEDERHDKAIDVAHQGNFKQALDMLDKIIAEKGWNEKLVYDYLSILSWDGQYEKAYKTFEEKVTNDPKELPVHVLDAMAKSCRELKYDEKSRLFYSLILEKNPQNVDASTGLKLSESEPESEDENTEHDKAIAIARKGNTKQALIMLDKIIKKNGWNEKRVHDYIIVLTWDGQYEKAYKIFQAKVTEPKELPIGVLDSLGRVCRELKNYEKSRFFYLLTLKKEPKNVDAHIGLAFILIEEEYAEEAIDLLKPFKNDRQKGFEVLKLLGVAYMHINHFIDALDCYIRALAIKPHDKEAIQGKAKALNEMLASYEAAKSPNLPPNLYQKIKSSEAALEIRWGIATSYPHNYMHFDKAIKKLTTINPSERNTYDLIVVYNRRDRHKDALSLYDGLIKSGKTNEDIPNEVLEAVAGSYLNQHDPVAAKEVYGFVLTRQPDSIESLQGYYYALLENEEIDESLDFIAEHYQDHKKFVVFGGRENVANGNRDSLESLHDKSLLYANLLSASEKKLSERIKVTPYNSDTRMMLAATYAARGLPRSADKELGIAFANDPYNVELKIAHIGILMAQYRYREAESLLTELRVTNPDNDALKKAEQEWWAYRAQEFEAGYEFQKGGLASSGVSELAMKLYSRPIFYNFRAYMATTYLFGKFPNAGGTLWYIQGGIGIDYKSTPFSATLELNERHFKGRLRTGGIASVNVTPSDHWAFAAKADLYSTETPGQALSSGISSNYFNVAVNYLYNNALKTGVLLFDQAFSDSNRWLGGSVFVQGQVVERPREALDLRLDVGTRNARTSDVPYFSPRKDGYASLSAIFGQTIYRNYDFSFKHIITPAVGKYWEKGFKQSTTFGLTYEQQIAEQNWYLLRYGISRSRATYSGAPEYATSVYVNLNIKF